MTEQIRGTDIDTDGDDQGTGAHVDQVATAAFGGGDVDRGRGTGPHKDEVAAAAFGDEGAKPAADEDADDITTSGTTTRERQEPA